MSWKSWQHKCLQVEKELEQLQTENKEKQELIDDLCSQEPCEKCGFGVTGQCYGCIITQQQGRLNRLRDGHIAVMKEINDNPALHNDSAITRLYRIAQQALKENADGKG